MAGHTPGDWVADGECIKHADGIVAFTAIPRDINEDRLDGECWLDMRRRTEPDRLAVASEQRANTLLLAAASDLLEALRLADATLSGANMNKKVVERKVRAAIAKATGATP